jgi:hypothetical protein
MAGLLGDIFGAADTAKRKLRDVVANPLLSAQQFLGNVNDRARNLNEMTAAAALEGVDYGPASQRLGGLLADAYNPMGLTVFHGSPAKFNRFDPTKIGSGEGAQAYGYGHYVAESPAVAREYRTALSEPELFKKGRQIKTTAGSNMDTAKAWLQEAFDAGSANPFNDAIAKVSDAPLKDKRGVINALQKLQSRGVEMKKGGYEYTIDLPDEQIAMMLDYDKPLSEQSKQVQQAYKNYLKTPQAIEVAKQWTRYKEGMSLDQAEPLLSAKNNPSVSNILKNAFSSPQEASDFFRNKGIPGVRFLDQNSRSNFRVQNFVRGKLYGEPVSFMTEQQARDYAAEQAQKGFQSEIIPGTSNFVVFPGNENLLNIKKRNDDPLGLFD